MWPRSIIILLFISYGLHGHCLDSERAEPAGLDSIMHPPIPGQQKLFGGSEENDGEKRESKSEHIIRHFDQNTLGCVELQNVTLHVGNRSVVYYDGQVRALPNVEPTVWMLRPYPSREGLWKIDHYDPWGQEISWEIRSNELRVTRSAADPFKIRYAYLPANPDISVVFAYDDNCIMFGQDGVAQPRGMTLCKPITLRFANPVFWQNPTEREGCAATTVEKLLHRLKNSTDIQGIQDIDVMWYV